MAVNNNGSVGNYSLILVNDNGTLRRVNYMRINNNGALAAPVYNVVKYSSWVTSFTTSVLTSNSTSVSTLTTWNTSIVTSRSTSIATTTTFNTSQLTSAPASRVTSVLTSRSTNVTTSTNTGVPVCLALGALVKKADGSKTKVELLEGSEGEALMSFDLPGLKPETVEDYRVWRADSLVGWRKTSTNLDKVERGFSDRLIKVVTEDGADRAPVTPTHPYLVHDGQTHRMATADELQTGWKVFDEDMQERVIVSLENQLGKFPIWKLFCSPYDLFVHDDLIGHNMKPGGNYTSYITTSWTTVATTTYYSSYTTSWTTTYTTTFATSRATTTTFTTSYSTVFATSAYTTTTFTTSYTTSFTTSVTTSGYFRLTADNAGGYRYTAVADATTYGHSYVNAGTWVETV